MVYQVLDAWNRIDPVAKEKLIAGEWARSDLRFVLPVLAEIHAKKLSPEPSGADIVKLSRDMPWIADPKFDLAKGALGHLPDTLKLKPSTSGMPSGNAASNEKESAY